MRIELVEKVKEGVMRPCSDKRLIRGSDWFWMTHPTKLVKFYTPEEFNELVKNYQYQLTNVEYLALQYLIQEANTNNCIISVEKTRDEFASSMQNLEVV